MPPEISVRQGDITDYDGDAVVNAANNRLQLGAGVAGAIARKGGPSVQEECDRHGSIRVGQAALTGAGDLKVRWVIHAAAMGEEPVTEKSIRESTEASLKLASDKGMKRIALPVLGSGVGGFPLTRAAEVMLDVVRHSPHGVSLDEVVFYGYSPADAEALRAIIE